MPANRPMFFNGHEADINTLRKTLKRARSIGKPGHIQPGHPLEALWSNTKMLLDAKDYSSYSDPEAVRYDLLLLSFLGTKLDDYSKNNLISEDVSIAHMLHEWEDYASRICDLSTLRTKHEELMEDISNPAKQIESILRKGGGGYCVISAIGEHNGFVSARLSDGGYNERNKEELKQVLKDELDKH